MNRDEILALAADTGAVAYSPPPLRAVRGYSFTYDALEAFYHAAIQQYKDSLLKDVGEPVGYLRTTEKALVFMPLTHVKDGEYFFTESQLLAALAKKEEEIEQLKDAQFKRLEREAEKRMELHQQLKAAQEDITEMRADHLMLVEENHALRDQLATAEQRVAEACAKVANNLSTKPWVHCPTSSHAVDLASFSIAKIIRSGEWRKFVKGN